MKIITIVGARPQFIKAAAVSKEIVKRNKIEEIIIHTGQHHDENMSSIFFQELGIPNPKYNLGVSGGTHGLMTARMLEAIETVLLKEQPNVLLVYGDTNSTLAGALAAVKLGIPIAHVEAGLRSFNMAMPEEVNRIMTDAVSQMLLCPTENGVKNLIAEGKKSGVHNVGDVMFDVAITYKEIARSNSQIQSTLNLNKRDYVLTTCHRAENTNNKERLFQILKGLSDISRQMKVVFPMHPRTKKLIAEYGYQEMLQNLIITEPLSYIDIVALEQEAKLIVTDSGGMQKEAYFYDTPCITTRDETEWTETVEQGANVLAGADSEKIATSFERLIAGNWQPDFESQPYGNGQAAEKIVNILEMH